MRERTRARKREGERERTKEGERESKQERERERERERDLQRVIQIRKASVVVGEHIACDARNVHQTLQKKGG